MTRSPGRRAYDSPLLRTAGLVIAAPFIATWHGAGWLVSPFTGPDGRPSFSKLVTLAVLAFYLFSANLPALVAVVIIVSAHGTKALLAWINKGTLTGTAASSFSTTVAGTVGNLFGRRPADAAHAAAPVVAATAVDVAPDVAQRLAVAASAEPAATDDERDPGEVGD